MPLTDLLIKSSSPKDKPYKLSDSKGLYLLVKPNGKYWRLKYRFAGKEKTLALGVYPTISLKQARLKTDEAKQKLLNGIDPSELRKLEKENRLDAHANSFKAIGEEWYLLQKRTWSDSHAKKVLWLLNDNLFPWLGPKPIAELSVPDILSALRRIESRGAIETANRAKQVAGQIFRFAVATGRAPRDPTHDLRGALATPQTKHHAAIIDPKQVGQLMLNIKNYQGTPIVRAALQLHALLFQRPGEIRTMRWDAIDFETCEWRYLVTKTKTPHIVPLCTQAIEILKDIKPLTNRSEYVFPSARGADRPLSENAVRLALRTMGYDNNTMTAHGFRAMARTLLDEVLEIRTDWIEHQLAHAVKDANGTAYNRTKHIEKRREMMQMWADYLNSLEIAALTQRDIT